MLYLEIFLVVLVIALQLGLFFFNSKRISGVSDFFPDRKSLSVYQKTIEQEVNNQTFTYKVDQLAASPSSKAFKAVLEDTNNYLLQNKGSAASFELLKDIAHRPYKLAANEASANLNTPFFVGLLGTFLALGLGLVGIIKKGLTEPAIQSFLVGFAVAMACSFSGLLFTLLGRYYFRQAKLWTDEKEHIYFSFLQSRLLPRLQQDMAQSLGNLRMVLDEFNKDFFLKIVDFKEVFANLSKYVGVQEKFLSALENLGYTRITEANMQFLDKISENAGLFESFGVYQKKLNESLQLGAEAARDVREVVERLRQIDDIQAYIRQNEEMIRKQLGYLSAHQDRLEDLSQGIQQHFVEAGDEIGKLVQERLRIMKKEEQDAGEELRQHFSRLQEENVYQKIAEQLQPIGQMKQEWAGLSQEVLDNSKMLLETSEYIVKKINQDSRFHGVLLQEIQELNKHMAQLNEPKSFWQQLLGRGKANSKKR